MARGRWTGGHLLELWQELRQLLTTACCVYSDAGAFAFSLMHHVQYAEDRPIPSLFETVQTANCELAPPGVRRYSD
jgi:hypothetical protein